MTISFKNKTPRVLASEILAMGTTQQELSKEIKLLSRDPLGLMVLSEIEFYINKKLAEENIQKRLPLSELESKPFFSRPIYISSYMYLARKGLTAENVSWGWERYHIELCEDVLSKVHKEAPEDFEKQYQSLAKIFTPLPGGSYSNKKMYAASSTPQRSLNFARLLVEFDTTDFEFMSEYDWRDKVLSTAPEDKKAYWIAKTLFLSNSSFSYVHNERMLDKNIIPGMKEMIRVEDFLALDYILNRLDIKKEVFWAQLYKATQPKFVDFLKNHEFEKTLEEQKLIQSQLPSIGESVAFKHKI